KEIGANGEDIPKLVEKLRINVGERVGNFKSLTMEDAENIYHIACK
ncbi:MAG: NADH-dependent alcohol dehydrogenase, partial [Firmicutes bacterium HGW-Firmicutes-3]